MAKRYMRAAMLLLLFGLSVLYLAGCAATQETTATKAETTVAATDAQLPRSVAILPFYNDTQEVDIPAILRKAFYNHMSSKPYTDTELPVVDEKVVVIEKAAAKSYKDISSEEIGKSIGVDGVIYGRIIDYKKVYAGVYSQLGLEAEVWMVDAKTGKEVFRLKDAVRYHEGGVPMSPLGMIMTAVSTALNLREIQSVRMVNELCYKLTEKMPSPKNVVKDKSPLIKEILSNAKEGPFGKGKVVRVGLEGDPGMVATFEIGNFRKGLVMKETKPGIYLGEYLVLPGDNTKDMPVVAYLKRPGGSESRWTDIGGLVDIDTTPPPQVANLKAKKYGDRVEIVWDGLKNIPDLKSYRVLRSETPLSGFTEIAASEHARYEDRALKPGVNYYYRVAAVDRAGNESEQQDAVMGMLLSKEPVALSGDITKDTILAGTYRISGDVRVLKGVTLTVEPETSLLFVENAALIVNGRMQASAKDAPVMFTGVDGKRWTGISVDGGSVALNGVVVKNANVGVLMKNASGALENGVIGDCVTGVSVSGTSSVVIRSSTISGNKVGVELEKTDAAILAGNIIQNKTGIVFKGFSGEMKDNNILNNETSFSSEQPVTLGPNYLGTVNVDEMKISAKELVMEKVYDGRVPGGRIVAAVFNPYTKMTAEEKEKKRAELLAEAGAFFRERNYGKASGLFEEALKVMPTSKIYYYLAFCYQEMKEDDRAIKHLKDGVEKFPKDSELLRALGLIYYNKGNEGEAKKLFEEVLRLNPDDRQIKFMMERTGK